MKQGKEHSVDEPSKYKKAWTENDFIEILIENYQAQIAGFYNYDKTDKEREIRNAVIQEYQDLIAIYKHWKKSQSTQVNDGLQWVSASERLPERPEKKQYQRVLCGHYSDTGNFFQHIGFYAEKHNVPYEDYDYDGDYDPVEESHGQLYLKEGWYEMVESNGEYDYVFEKRKVTHWMHLPQPPHETPNQISGKRTYNDVHSKVWDLCRQAGMEDYSGSGLEQIIHFLEQQKDSNSEPLISGNKVNDEGDGINYRANMKYKVIADYPESPYKIGDIVDSEFWTDDPKDGLHNYPKIFEPTLFAQQPANEPTDPSQSKQQ